jgi:hypothetical protein
VELAIHEGQAMPGRQLADAATDRAIEGEDNARKSGSSPDRFRLKAGDERERPAFGAESQPPAVLPVEERFLPERIASAEELVRAAVVDREREHAVEAFDDL